GASRFYGRSAGATAIGTDRYPPGTTLRLRVGHGFGRGSRGSGRQDVRKRCVRPERSGRNAEAAFPYPRHPYTDDPWAIDPRVRRLEAGVVPRNPRVNHPRVIQLFRLWATDPWVQALETGVVPWNQWVNHPRVQELSRPWVIDPEVDHQIRPWVV